MSPREAVAWLSPRQSVVVLGFVAGGSYESIALEMGVSAWTVRSHVRQANDRLPSDFATHQRGITRLLMWYAATQLGRAA